MRTPFFQEKAGDLPAIRTKRPLLWFLRGLLCLRRGHRRYRAVDYAGRNRVESWVCSRCGALKVLNRRPSF